MGVSLGLAGLVLAFSAGDARTQAQVLQGGQSLRAAGAVTFAPFYKAGGETSKNSGALEMISGEIASGRAYTAIINNLGVDNPESQGSFPPIVLIGDAIPRLFPGLQLCDPAPCAMYGQQLTGEDVDREKSSLPRSISSRGFSSKQRFPSGAVLFDPSTAGLELDDRVVFRLPNSDIAEFGAVESEEMLTRFVSLRPSSELELEYVTLAAQNDLHLVPYDISVTQPRRFDEILVRSALYILGVFAFAVCSIGVFAGVLGRALESEIAGFVVRRWFGASRNALRVRVLGFVVFAAGVIPILILTPLAILGGPWSSSAAGVLLVMVLISVYFWLAGVSKVFRYID